MKNPFFLFCILLFLSCNNKDCSESVNRISLNSETLYLDEYLGRTYTIEIADSYLILRDDQFETKLTIFNLNSNDVKPIYSGYIGQGPGELINPGAITVNSGNEFSVYDGSKMQLLSFDMDSIKITGYRPRKFISVKESGIIDLKRLNKDMFIAVGVFPEKRFSVINTHGETVCSLGTYPINLIEGMPEYIRGIACQSMLTTNCEKNTVATALRYGEHIQFHQISDDCSIKLLNERSVFLPEYTTKNDNAYPNFSPSEKTRWGYLSITSNADFVYALYSGKLQKHGEKFNQGNEIHVFDWDGNFLQIIELDKNVLSVTCSSTQLYALFEGEKGFEIAKYQLLNN